MHQNTASPLKNVEAASACALVRKSCGLTERIDEVIASKLLGSLHSALRITAVVACNSNARHCLFKLSRCQFAARSLNIKKHVSLLALIGLQNRCIRHSESNASS
jgi:hypothetical protein